MNKTLQLILQECDMLPSDIKPVSGGDINQCYCVQGQGRKYFLKINNADSYPKMFEKEAKGLLVLKKECSLIIPEVFRTGANDGMQYLLMEWLEKGKPKPDFSVQFGRELALMHKKEQPFFGFEEDNYIGSIPQVNTKAESWSEFFCQSRITPLVKLLYHSGAYSDLHVRQTESLCRRLDELFPMEPPALLHGDLWGGNYMVSANGYAALYDPAVYFGHREMDIGMTRLFGGFDSSFYHAYNEIYPLKKGWETRIDLSQLYPLLVHAVLFDGHYINSAAAIIRKYS